jgi:hypothetical protein
VFGPIPGFGASVASGIDDKGTVGGQAFTDGTPSKEGYIWQPSGGVTLIDSMNDVEAIIDLPNSGQTGATLAGEDRMSQAEAAIASDVTSTSPIVTVLGPGAFFAQAINHLGHVVGEPGFFWTPTSLIFLSTSTVFVDTLAINDADTVVGTMNPLGTGMARLKTQPQTHRPSLLRPRTLDNSQRAMIWTESLGAVDLNTLVGGNADWTLSVANGINNKGEIVGTAFDQNQINKAYILEPN